MGEETRSLLLFHALQIQPQQPLPNLLLGQVTRPAIGGLGTLLLADKSRRVSGVNIVSLPVLTAKWNIILLNTRWESCIKELETEAAMMSQPWKFAPITALGKWSVRLIIAMPILFFIGGSLTNSLYPSVPAGNSIGEDIALRPVLALSMLAGTVAGISAFIIGLVSIIKKEKAILVYIACVIGALLLVFLAGEFIYPH